MSTNGFLGVLINLKDKADSWLVDLEYMCNKLYNLTITNEEIELSCNLIEKLTNTLVEYESMLLQLEYAKVITTQELNQLRIVKDFNRLQHDFSYGLEQFLQHKFKK